MALKDWHSVNVFKHDLIAKWGKYDKLQLFIRIASGKKYAVEVYNNGGIFPIHTDITKTKSQALKFAKSYMRTH